MIHTCKKEKAKNKVSEFRVREALKKPSGYTEFGAISLGREGK